MKASETAGVETAARSLGEITSLQGASETAVRTLRLLSLSTWPLRKQAGLCFTFVSLFTDPLTRPVGEAGAGVSDPQDRRPPRAALAPCSLPGGPVGSVVYKR